MIVPVTAQTLMQAAAVHAESWRESHRAFCTPAFVAAHTAQRQADYLDRALKQGKGLWMLVDAQPVGVVSVWGNLIENLYVLPAQQRKGYGSALLQFAAAQCTGTPTLWILNNNGRARNFYLKHGFQFTGREHPLSAGLTELEMALTPGANKKACPFQTGRLLRCGFSQSST